jgi:maltose O-acetyltransferase
MKPLIWSLLDELRAATLSLLTWLPTELGVIARRRLLRHFLGHVGRNARILPGLRLTNPEKIRIGSNCNLNYNVFIAGGGEVTIGDWVGFGPDVKIWSVNHRFDDPDTPWQKQGWNSDPVKIEDDVWVAANVFVMPGVTIGHGAILSAGSVVNKSIPPFAIVAGNPARVIGWRRPQVAVAEDVPSGCGSATVTVLTEEFRHCGNPPSQAGSLQVRT